MLSKNRAEKTAAAALKSGFYVLIFKKEHRTLHIGTKKLPSSLQLDLKGVLTILQMGK